MVARLAAKAATKFLKELTKPKAKPKVRQDFDDSNFPNVEYRLKSRGMTSAQKRQLRRKMGLSDDSPKAEKPEAEKPKAKKPKAKKPDAAAKQFMRNKPATGMGTDKRKPKSKIMKLQQKYEDLTPEYKRAERAKGEQSIYYPVFKKLGMGKVGSITKKKHGGKVVSKRNGGMTRVGLSPAEEARAGTLPKAERARYMQGGGPIHTTFPKRAAPRTEGRETSIDLFPKVERKNSGKVGKQKAAVKKIASRIKGSKQNRKKKKEAGEIGLSPKGTEAVERLKDSKYWAKAVGLPSQLPKVTKAPTEKAKTAARPDRKLTSLKKGGQVGSMETDGNKLVASYYTKL